MTRDQVLAHLAVIRASVDALEAALLEAPPAPAGCEHPPELRQDCSTMRTRRFYCQGCKAIVTEGQPSEKET